MNGTTADKNSTLDKTLTYGVYGLNIITPVTSSIVAIVGLIIALCTKSKSSNFDKSHKKAQIHLFIRALILFVPAFLLSIVGYALVSYSAQNAAYSYYARGSHQASTSLVIGGFIGSVSSILFVVIAVWFVVNSVIGIVAYTRKQYFDGFIGGILLARFTKEIPVESNISSVSPSSSDLATILSGKPVSVIYILYFAAYLFGITALVGVIIAYMKKDNPSNTQVDKDHYNFLISTFWRGLIYLVVGGILSIVVIGVFIILWWYVWSLINIIQGFMAYNEGKSVTKSSFFGFAKFS